MQAQIATKFPARAALHKLTAQAEAVQVDINRIRQTGQQFERAIAATQSRLAEIAASPVMDKAQLAAVAYGEAGADVVKLLKRARTDAAEAAQQVQLEAEIAAAGLERSRAEQQPLVAKLTQINSGVGALAYAARVEIAEENLVAYRAAFSALAAAHAKLLGSCLALDAYAAARPVGDNKRSPVTQALNYMRLTLPLPLVPSVVEAIPVERPRVLDVDVSDSVMDAMRNMEDAIREPA